MAFLGRGVGRQQAGSHCLQELSPSLSGAWPGWSSQPSPWPWGLVGSCPGEIRTSSCGSVWDRDTSPPSIWDGQASLTWLWAISVSPWFKNQLFISGWLVPTVLSAISSLHSPVPQLFLTP